MITAFKRYAQLCLLLAVMATFVSACKTAKSGESGNTSSLPKGGGKSVLTPESGSLFATQFLTAYTDLAKGLKTNDSLLAYLSPAYFTQAGLDKKTYTVNYYMWDAFEIAKYESGKLEVVFSNTAENWKSKASFQLVEEGGKIYVKPGAADPMTVAQDVRFVDPWQSIEEPQ